MIRKLLLLGLTFSYNDSTPCYQARAIKITQEQVNEFFTWSTRQQYGFFFQSLCTNP